MAVVEIPLPSDLPHFDLIVSLDGVSYRLLFRWNDRSESWFLDLSLEDDTLIWASIRVVVSWPLGRRSQHPSRPPGMLLATDTTARATDPGLTDLGARVRLYYWDAAELSALGGA